jgi:hypothetical protein
MTLELRKYKLGRNFIRRHDTNISHVIDQDMCQFQDTLCDTCNEQFCYGDRFND